MNRAVLATVISLVFSLILITQAAPYSGGDGTADSPYVITTLADWDYLCSMPGDWASHFMLGGQIDLAGRLYSCAPIAPDTDNSTMRDFNGTAFTGTFDGRGYAIQNLTIETRSTGNDYIGLFGYLGPDSQVSNLNLEEMVIDVGGRELDAVSVTVAYYLGGLVGYSEGTVRDCHASGGGLLVDQYGNSIGGLIGRNVGRVMYCSTADTLIVGRRSVSAGGLVGDNRGVMEQCYAVGAVIIAGSNASIISGSWIFRLGGFAGINSGGTIRHCYAMGSITGFGNEPLEQFGGFAGRNQDGIIEYCYSTGNISCGVDVLNVGGLVGYHSGGAISQCFWDIETSLQSVSAGGTGKTTAEMQTLSTFTLAGWDFTNETLNGTNNFWRMCTNAVDYPRLNWKSIKGDFACPDGVNIEDLSCSAGNWLMKGCSSVNNYCGGTDLNYSGIVDLADWAILAGNWLSQQTTL